MRSARKPPSRTPPDAPKRKTERSGAPSATGQAVELVHQRREERLQADGGPAQEDEEGEAKHDRDRDEGSDTLPHGGEPTGPVRARRGGVANARAGQRRRLVARVEEQVPVEEQDQKQHEAARPGHHQRGAPAELQREPHHDDGGERVAQIAAQRVEAVGPAVARAPDARGEDGEIGRVEHAVAEPCEHGKREQHPERGREPHQQDRNAKQREPAQQHGACREAVDQETRAGLRDAGGHVEHGHQGAELGVADRKRFLEVREERRQGELVEVARAVGECDQPHDAGLAVSGRLLNGHRISSRNGAAGRAARTGRPRYARDARAGNGLSRRRPLPKIVIDAYLKRWYEYSIHILNNSE